MAHDLLHALWRESRCVDDFNYLKKIPDDQHQSFIVSGLSPYLIKKTREIHHLFHKKDVLKSGTAKDILQLLVSFISRDHMGNDALKEKAIALMSGILFALVEIRENNGEVITLDSLSEWCHLPLINDLITEASGALSSMAKSSIYNGLSLIPHWDDKKDILNQEPDVTRYVRYIYSFWNELLRDTDERDTVLYGLCYLQAFADFLLECTVDTQGRPGVLNKQVKEYIHPSEYSVNTPKHQLYVRLPKSVEQAIKYSVSRHLNSIQSP